MSDKGRLEVNKIKDLVQFAGKNICLVGLPDMPTVKRRIIPLLKEERERDEKKLQK